MRAGIRPTVLFIFLFLSALLTARTPVEPAPSPDDQVVRAVVELLAIGPGGSGKNLECSGTGFLVNEEGYILTNAHVFEEAQRCLGVSQSAKILAKMASPATDRALATSCELVGLDEAHDLAVLKMEHPFEAAPAKVRSRFVRFEPAEVAVGTRVAVTGHPRFIWNPVTQAGNLLRRERLLLDERSKSPTEVIIVNIPLKPGNSGSPVYLEAGGVVGIVESRNPSRPSETRAVPARYAIELLNRNRVRWHETCPPRPVPPDSDRGREKRGSQKELR